MSNGEGAVRHQPLASQKIILRLTQCGKRKTPDRFVNRSGAETCHAYSTQGQIAHLPFPLTFKAALSQQQDIFDSNAGWNIATNLENTRH